MIDAYEGYAIKKGIKKHKDRYPTLDELRQREKEYQEWLISKSS